MKHLHRHVALERRCLVAACLLRLLRIGNGVAAGFTQSSKAVGAYRCVCDVDRWEQI